ncbi:hypothetical protein ANN_09938 [Periplaneta americana]|uniref:Per a allergen n=1 Tax=Periplaneta americana TaxID=6978 RepID=A0ABQ8TN28_PERAM|nr:hypothetical protein ANN_09938 [Periplaneta americana]
MDLREKGYYDRDWINLEQDRDRLRAYTLALPYFDYADILQTDVFNANKMKLQCAHNLYVPFVSNVRKYDHITPSLEAIEHYGKIMEVIDAVDSTDSSAVAAVKSLPSEQLLEDILFIDSNFKIVSKSIILLESSKLQLSEALNIVDKVSQTVIQNNNSLISEKVK